jgi:hypothetical protein
MLHMHILADYADYEIQTFIEHHLRESVDIEFYFSNVLHFNWSINRNNKHKMKNKEIAHCPNNSKIKYQNHRRRTIRYPLTHKYITKITECTRVPVP